MGYKVSKPFKENGVEKVNVKVSKGIRGFWDSGKEKLVKEMTFEVVANEKICNWIEKKNPINLKGKYVKEFSLKKFREDKALGEKDKVTLKDFNAEGAFFDKGADFSYAVFEGKFTFQDSSFGDGDVYFSPCVSFGDGDVDFRGANFVKGNVFFTGVAFGNGRVSFDSAIFEKGNVFFDSATFGKGYVDFLDVVFRDGFVAFSEVSFGDGDVCFERADFGKGKVDFGGANFGKGYVDFVGSSFGDEIVSFWDVNFGKGNVWFKLATFGDKGVDFSDLKVEGDWDMRVKSANIISFSNSKIYGNIDFGFYKDYEENEGTPYVKELRLVNTKLYGTIHMDYDAFNMPDAINNQEDTSHRQKRDQFRLLKENFRRLGQYDDEDKTYVQFMYHKIREEEFELSGGLHSHFKKWFTEKKWNIKKVVGIFAGSFAWVLDSFVFFFKWLLYEKMGLYGTSPLRVASSMLVVISVFAWMYSKLPPPLEGSPSPFFHSVITFLTIGYGINYANLSSFAGKLFSGIEGFAGLFLMAYFTIAFVRKVLR